MTRILSLMPTVGVTSRPTRRFFDRFFDDWMNPHDVFEGSREWAPASEITERDNEVLVTVELPGVDMKGIDISYEEGVLTIKGEKKNGLAENECCYCSERYSGSFHRALPIPGKVVADKIDATLKDGILRVVLPKSEVSIGKKIEVH